MANTLIITLKLEEAAQSFFEEKRSFYFPRHCNYVPAHCTFFHGAPNQPEFIESLKKFAGQPEMVIETTGVLPFANGIAYSLSNSYLEEAHAQLQEKFSNHLSGKDKKIWKPHITVQNKVTAFKAESSFKKLAENFVPFNFKAEGFNGYVYAKQKWDFSFFIPFATL